MFSPMAYELKKSLEEQEPEWRHAELGGFASLGELACHRRVDRKEDRMKHKLFSLLWLAALAFFCVVTGVLALLGYWDAEVVFWIKSAIESESGKIAWIVVSASLFMICLVLTVREYRNNKRRSSTWHSDATIRG